MSIEYAYVDFNGLEVPISRFNAVEYDSPDTISRLTAQRFNELIADSELTGEDFMFGYGAREVGNGIVIQASGLTPTVKLSIINSGYIIIDWGDGSTDTAITEADMSHIYTDGLSSHEIIISGVMENIYRFWIIDGESTDIQLDRRLTSLIFISAGESLFTSLIIPAELTSLIYINVNTSPLLEKVVVPNNALAMETFVSYQCPAFEELNISRYWNDFEYLSIDNSSHQNASLNALMYEFAQSLDTRAVAIEFYARGFSVGDVDETSGGINGVEAYWAIKDDARFSHIVDLNNTPSRTASYIPTTNGDGFKDLESSSSSGVKSLREFILVDNLLLGDFVAEDDIPQNEYILLNAKEGSFLQNPLQGVGIHGYTQSPSSNQQLIDNVVEKFALDSLRVIGISKVGDDLSIESEDYNTRNGDI